MTSDLNQLKIIFVVIYHTNGIKVYFGYGVIKFVCVIFMMLLFSID